MATMIKLKCDICKKHFDVEFKKYNFLINKKKNKIFCSYFCHYINVQNKKENTAKCVKREVKKYILENGVIPTSLFNKKWGKWAGKNGGWNNLIKELGFQPRVNYKFTKNGIKCLDGHDADSFSEKLIDDMLFENNIRHIRSKPYPVGSKNCDFYLVDYDIWVEYFGLSENNKKYQKSMIEKMDIVDRYRLDLLALFPEINNLDIILKKIRAKTRLCKKYKGGGQL